MSTAYPSLATSEFPREVPSVTAKLRYLTPDSPPPRVYSAAMANATRREGTYADYSMNIVDGRALEHTQGRRFNLDIEGFELHRQITQIQDFQDLREVEQVYYPEATRLLKLATGASAVHIFDHTVRIEDPEKRERSGLREPVHSVHNDYTEKSGPRRVWDLMPPDQARYWLDHRFAIINVWRSIAGPVLTQPLGLIDARSMRRRDFVPADLIYPDRVGEIYQIAHSALHQWVFFSGMHRNEALLLKVFDSAQDGRARMIGHSAFDHPGAARGASPRESIELRALVSFAPVPASAPGSAASQTAP